MKYSMFKTSIPRMLRKEDAGQYIGSPQLLKFMENAEPPWIKPVVSKHKLVLFDVKHLDACCDRLSRGEFPGEGA